MAASSVLRTSPVFANQQPARALRPLPSEPGFRSWTSVEFSSVDVTTRHREEASSTEIPATSPLAFGEVAGIFLTFLTFLTLAALA